MCLRKVQNGKNICYLCSHKLFMKRLKIFDSKEDYRCVTLFEELLNGINRKNFLLKNIEKSEKMENFQLLQNRKF